MQIGKQPSAVRGRSRFRRSLDFPTRIESSLPILLNASRISPLVIVSKGCQSKGTASTCATGLMPALADHMRNRGELE
jgi:hypothetical protein